MAIDALVALLEQRAQEEREEIIGQAQRQADELKEASAAQVVEDQETALGDIENMARRAAAEAVGKAKAGARRQVMMNRQEILEKVYADAEARLLEHVLRSEPKQDLVRDFEEAISCLPDRDARLRCIPEFADLLQDAAEAMGVDIEVDEKAPVGVVVSAKDGSVVVDNSLSTRMKRRKADLAVAIAGALE
ncbi:MAG: V-type ATP synthase subunit E [Gemmatimonadota bacterium]|nr:V-type ATP synthase subunit E [Gemmatimonadota bacterium]